MEPFKIICVTCQAKLSVRNESLIGQIVACPRCDSMVEVMAPAAAALPAAAVEATVPEQTAPSPPPQPESVPDALLVSEQAAEQATAVVATSAQAAKYKIIAWSLASFLIGATFVGGILFTRNAPTNEAAALVPHTEKTPTLPSKNPTLPKDPVAALPPNAETQPEITPKAKVPAPDAEASLAIKPIDEPVAQPSPTEPAEEPLTPEPEKSPRIARRFDPLDFDPESMTLATVDQPVETVELTEPATADEPVETLEDIPSTMPLVRRGSDTGIETISRDADKQLALLIPKVSFDRLPLIDCLQLFSRMSGVPISVSPEQLLMAGITPQKQVSLDASETSLGEMLERVLKPLHLEYTTHGEQVVVARHESTKHREISYPIDDMVGEQTSKEELASWVKQLVAPATWQSAGGEGALDATTEKLRVGQTQQVQYQVLILLERLRLARGLPPQSRYPVKRLAGTPANALLQEKLATPTTFTFSQFTPIEEVFVHWQTELGTPLQIDWPALAKAEVWPATTIACAINDQHWSVALEKVLEPLGLGWRATTGSAIEITSAFKVQNELQLELYPLQRELEGQVAQLQSLIQHQTAGTILYDPTGKVMLVLEPAATQRIIFRQLRKQNLLD